MPPELKYKLTIHRGDFADKVNLQYITYSTHTHTHTHPSLHLGVLPSIPPKDKL